jgi:magnesium transporter
MQLTPTVISAQPLENAIRGYLERNDLIGLRSFLAAQKAPDIADVLERLTEEDRALVFAQFAPQLAAGVLAEVGSENKRELILSLSREQLSQVVNHLPMDDVTRLIADVPEFKEDVLADLSSRVAQEVRNNLQYPEDSAGRLMTEKFVTVTPEMTAQEAVEHLRKVHRDAETFTDLYIVDDDDHLEGVTSLRDLIIARPEQQLREFMVKEVISVAPTDDQEVAARLMAHYNFLALPVTRDGRILGVITVDDIIDVLIEEGTEDQLRFGAVEPGIVNQPYFTTPIWRVVRSRAGWLILLFVAETLTGTVLRHFEEELDKVVALAFFVPLLIGTGGNTGAQTVSTIIRGLALREIRVRDTWRVLLRELLGGVLLGSCLALVAFGRSELWGSGLELSIVVSLSVLCIVIWANLIGSLIPLVAQRLKIDPALVSAPLITTLVDATGLVIYLTIAKSILTALKS